jgi:hypothetical protein
LDCELHFSEPDREGWMQTTVQVKTPWCNGTFTCSVERKEWEGFVKTLKDLDASVGRDVDASWGNMEGNIEFQFSLKSLGNLEGRYRFSPDDVGSGPTIEGPFEADQTFLQRWARSAERVLREAR